MTASFHNSSENMNQRELTASRKQLQQLQAQQQENLSANRRAEKSKQKLIDRLESTLSQTDVLLEAKQEKLRCVTVEVDK